MKANDSLAGRHALVTGGGRGIGAAIAGALLEQGARVTITGRKREALAATVADLSMLGEIASEAMDVTSAESVAQAFAAAEARFGPVSVLVNNAGQAASAPLLKTGEDVWNQMLAVNLTGTWHCIRAALPAMLEARWGRIVNVASTAGLTGYGYVSAYCAAKHGVVGLTRSLALEVAAKGVTVNAVCPGYTETDIVREAVANIVAKTGRSEEQALAELASTNPQRRLVQPDEVANAVVWLCMPGAGAMNGQAVAVAGGEVM
ncbi:SDR family NAD(P)-dependent oxidoreductase [Massilia sp. Mn16-1_5]|uniref:SDR family NAD(P)-dependent oxidoreductase n=1 Tax=Massilia sp. Mn16-1_5 TaxID=2079199 RepID=UPI00109E4C3A|nr:SDR family NAD(P)-dependent oxidoreductase [Massilia sp. Mn16-1_5]THC45250.1 3-hydroxyacyl-CoA dehydrogenase [Massilia sp. Mn16-1_5]